MKVLRRLRVFHGAAARPGMALCAGFAFDRFGLRYSASIPILRISART